MFYVMRHIASLYVKVMNGAGVPEVEDYECVYETESFVDACARRDLLQEQRWPELRP